MHEWSFQAPGVSHEVVPEGFLMYAQSSLFPALLGSPGFQFVYDMADPSRTHNHVPSAKASVAPSHAWATLPAAVNTETKNSFS